MGIGSIVSSAIGFAGGERANRANKKLARENREWQERMSNTAHVREVADLRAAGLNPILSATGGKGASTPGGAQATFQNSAKNVSADYNARKIVEEQVKNLKENNTLTKHQQALTRAQVSNTVQDTLNKIEQIPTIRANAELLKNSAKSVQNQGTLSDMEIKALETIPGAKLWQTIKAIIK